MSSPLSFSYWINMPSGGAGQSVGGEYRVKEVLFLKFMLFFNTYIMDECYLISLTLPTPMSTCHCKAYSAKWRKLILFQILGNKAETLSGYSDLAFFCNPSYPVLHSHWRWDCWSKLTSDCAINLIPCVKWQTHQKYKKLIFK